MKVKNSIDICKDTVLLGAFKCPTKWFSVVQAVVRYKGRLFVPKTPRRAVVKCCHYHSSVEAHMGTNEMVSALRKKCFMPKLLTVVASAASDCNLFSRNRNLRWKRLKRHPVPKFDFAIGNWISTASAL